MRSMDRRLPQWPVGGTGFRRKKPSRRLVTQIAVVAVLLLTILAIRDAKSPWGTEVRETLRSALTTEWDYEPVLNRLIAFGLQTVSVDMPFFDTLPHREKSPGGEVTEVMSSDDMLTLPVSGKVARGYGWVVDPLDNMERFHPGVDIAASPGTPVKAVLSGKVARIGEDRAYGNYILIDHGNRTYSLYGQVEDIQVAVGDSVSAGQVIAKTGGEDETGETGLHFEFRENGQLIDPLTKFDVP